MRSDALAANPDVRMRTEIEQPGLFQSIYPWQVAVALAHVALRMLPDRIAFTIRSRVYRLLGIDAAASAYIMGNIAFRGGTWGQHRLLKIGFRSRISSDLTVNLDEQIVIGDFVTIGPYVKLYTSTHDIAGSETRCDQKVVAKPIVIESGAWLALGVTVLPGVRIGKGVVVSAGSVVTRDLPPDTLCGGVPAQVIRPLSPTGA